MLKSGRSMVIVTEENYKKYQTLIMCVEKINKDILSDSLIIDYDAKDKYYSIIYPFKNGKPVKTYFFEQNDDVLVIMGEQGWGIISGGSDDKYNSIEDLICNG